MRNFYLNVVKHGRGIIVAFIAAAILGAFLSSFVGVNYDMKDYLPADSASTLSLDLLREQFDGGIPNARVMVKDVSLVEALAYKERLCAIDGVDGVMWLDDAADIMQPLSTLDEELVETYYKDGAALFVVTIAEDKRIEGVEAIRELIGDGNAMSGEAVATAAATTSTIAEVAQIAGIAVVFVLVVLAVTTTAWIEPLVILGGLGVAILINNGSNLIFGEVSFVTNAAGAILQLAVSLDYSVFLLHRYEECSRDIADPQEAMIAALCKSTSSILSSGLTTVIGFIALVFMRFGIGPDLGLALAKGVAISLITTFIFMPNLILAMNKLLAKTKHRSFMPSFKHFAKLITRVMIPLACAFVIIVVPAYLASNANAFYYGSSYIFGAGTQLGDDIKEIEQVFGKNDTYVLLVPRGSTATETELSEALHAMPELSSVISYVDTVGAEIPQAYLDAESLALLVSDDYSRFVLSLDTDYEGAATFRLVEAIRDTAEQYYPGSYYLAGEGVSTYDLMNTITADMLKVNLIAIGSVFVVLMLTMKSLTLPVLLVLAIETAIWINLAIPYFQGNVIFYISYLIISSIQLGATVDYAILFTDRYMEYRQSMNKREAVVQVVQSVTTSVLTSGVVLTVIGFLLGGISTHGILSQLGLFLGMGGLLSLSVVLFILPGLLNLCDGLIFRTTRGVQPYIEPEPNEIKEVATHETISA